MSELFTTEVFADVTVSCPIGMTGSTVHRFYTTYLIEAESQEAADAEASRQFWEDVKEKSLLTFQTRKAYIIKRNKD